MGKTKSIVHSNNMFWDIGEKTEFEFETGVFEIIRNELLSYIKSECLTVEQTERSGDNGKDIIITAKCNFKLFGIKFRLNDTKKTKIYIEIKSTTNNVLRDNSFSVNVDKNLSSPINYYVLLTNSKILANSYFRVQEAFRANNIQFVLMDEAIIAPYVNHYDVFNYAPIPKCKTPIYAEYISSSMDDDPPNTYRMFFLFRNYSKTSREFKLELITNINWTFTEETRVYIIDPNRAEAVSVLIEKKENGGDNRLTLALKSEKSFFSIEMGNVVREEFEPSFYGKDRYMIIEALKSRIQNEDDSLFCIWGEAGVGKSRLISELQKRIRGGQYYVDYYNLSKNNLTTLSKLKKDLNTFLPKTANLYETLNNYDNPLGKRVIIIDDLHNADEQTLLQIKEYYKKPNSQIKLVLIGRSDYSAGIPKYYDFIYWSRENLYNDSIDKTRAFWIETLSDEDGEKLIRSIIRDIPQAALEKIQKNSDNNPLFISQYIEYLLDKDLVYIANRNSVGITNINSFSSKRELPESIYSIYRERINNLKDQNQNLDFQSILVIFSFFEGFLEVDSQLNNLNIDPIIIRFLEEKRLIRYTEVNNSYQFIHESFKIYLNYNAERENRKAAAQIILADKQKTICSLNDYQLGRLYLWNNQITEAEKSFKKIINSINNQANISNVNIDMQMFEYYDDVYNLLKRRKGYSNTVASLLKSKAYITLHHLSPALAVVECDKILRLIYSSKTLITNKNLIMAILTEKAHALLNSGENFKGERLLIELYLDWLVTSDNTPTDELFDILDRLCAVNIRLGYHNTAKAFNNLSIGLSENLKQNSLKAIAYRTRAKLYYLNSPEECQNSISVVNDIFRAENNPRINLNNRIYQCIFDLTYDKKTPDEILKTLENTVSEARRYSFNRAMIQSYEVMCAALIKMNTKTSLEKALNYISVALDMSITFGISSYEWQLYNMRAIIYSIQGRELQHIKECFDTVLEILFNQNLLYLGGNCLCYGNTFAINNILMFYANHLDEKSFYDIYKRIINVGKNDSVFVYLPKTSVHTTTENYLYNRAKQTDSLFKNTKTHKNLFIGKYYIALT